MVSFLLKKTNNRLKVFSCRFVFVVHSAHTAHKGRVGVSRSCIFIMGYKPKRQSTTDQIQAERIVYKEFCYTPKHFKPFFAFKHV